MPSLVSVNVGLPQDVFWQGKVVRTAVWKRSIAGKVMARRLNLEGDGQGDLTGHGGEHRAVMVYQVESYRYWEAMLQRDELASGSFGENLTVDGLADSEVCIGDRYRIGAALFEVTQPRVTCYRVGIRMNNPQMPALLVSHRRPGFYCRVIEEGEICAGDEIVKVADGSERVTVADIDALLYLPSHPRDQLERALRLPSLSEGWKQSFKALLSASEDDGNAGLAAAVATPAWIGFRSLRIAERKQESEGVVSFMLEAVDHHSLPVPLAGQYLVFSLRVQGAPLVRSYSISGPPDTGTYRVSVKRDAGPGSQYFHDRLKPGDLLQVSAPRGNFTLIDTEQPVVLLSAGIGATPVLSMLHELAKRGATQQVWWCHGARNGREHPFAQEVQNTLRRLQSGHSIVAYSAPDAQDQLGVDYDTSGRLEVSVLQALGMPQTAHFYLCGPAGFLTDVSAALRGWDVPERCIHAETFGSGPSMTPGIAALPGPAPHPPSAIAGTGATVSFTRTGLAVPWDSKFANLLEFAEACDVPVRWSCRVGVCHTCQTGIIGGTTSYTPEPLEMPAQGTILICCARPLSAIELDL